jgi:hypothetical protein
MLLTVVGGILFASDHGLRVEETSVGTGSDLVNDIGLKIDLRSVVASSNRYKTHVERSGDVLAGSGLGEESRESIIFSSRRSIHQSTIGLGISVVESYRHTLRPCSIV